MYDKSPLRLVATNLCSLFSLLELQLSWRYLVWITPAQLIYRCIQKWLWKPKSFLSASHQAIFPTKAVVEEDSIHFDVCALVLGCRFCLVKTAVVCCIIASNRHLRNLLHIKYHIKRQAESCWHDSKRTIDMRHANSLESNSMTQEVAIQFPTPHLRDICFTLGNGY